jgi:hypothetical protein
VSQYLIELYTPNPTWQALPRQERIQFLNAIKDGMGGLASLGIEVLALGETEAGIDQASGHRFLGIWRFPDAQARDALLAGINASGWHGYFDHVNAASAGGDFASHLDALMAV